MNTAAASPLISALVSDLLFPLLMVVLTTAGAWLVSKLPGPIRDFLSSGTHKRDLDLLIGALARRAADNLRQGKGQDPEDLISYAQSALVETIAKLKPSDDALRTMAGAAIQGAVTAAAASSVAPVINVNGPDGGLPSAIAVEVSNQIAQFLQHNLGASKPPA